LQIVQKLPKCTILARHIELLSKQNKSKNSKINFYFFHIANYSAFFIGGVYNFFDISVNDTKEVLSFKFVQNCQCRLFQNDYIASLKSKKFVFFKCLKRFQFRIFFKWLTLKATGAKSGGGDKFAVPKSAVPSAAFVEYHKWNTEWQKNTSRLHTLIPSAGPSPPGMTLPRPFWVRPNCIHTGTGLFCSTIH